VWNGIAFVIANFRFDLLAIANLKKAQTLTNRKGFLNASLAIAAKGNPGVSPPAEWLSNYRQQPIEK